MRISLAEAQRMYIDYHCYGNTLHTSDETMGQIVYEYRDFLSSWQKSVSNDDNKYEFDDSEFENWKAEAEQKAKESTGYEDDGLDKVDQYGNSINSAVAGGAGALYAHATGGAQALGNLAKGNIEIGRGATFKAGMQNLGKDVKQEWTAVEGGKGALIQAAIAIATCAAYYANKPNKEQVKACDDLLEQMTELQEALVEYQAQMQQMAQEIAEAQDEAQSVNEEANENMDTSKTEFDVFVDAYSALVEKAKTEGLTDEERSLVENLLASMSTTGEDITTTQDDAQTTVGDIYSDMGTYQEGYDEAAQGMAGVQGVTDYAAEFDERTADLTKVAALGQAGNAVTGAMSGAKLILRGASKGWLGVAEIAIGLAAIAAGAGSGVAAKEQYDMSAQVGSEIGARESTQGLNENTQEVYGQEIENYAVSMETIENLELVVPDKVEVPEETIPQAQPQQNKQNNRFGKYTSKGRQ